jgi:zinc protease
LLLGKMFPGGHPYGQTGIGTRRSVRRMTRRDLRKFHRDHFTEEGAKLVVTAPFSAVAVRKVMGSRFRGFERVPSPAAPALPLVHALEPSRESIEMSGRTQVEIRIGGVSIARSSPHYAAVYLANQILGGRSMLGRLFQRVRERHGLAYHASSSVDAMRWGGYWVAEAGTGPERADRTVALVEKEVQRMAGELVGQPELDLIRESAIGELPLELEDTSSAHELAMDVAYHDLAPDFYRTWRDVLRSVTPIDLRRGAEVGMDGTHATTVLAGPRRRPGAPTPG